MSHHNLNIMTFINHYIYNVIHNDFKPTEEEQEIYRKCMNIQNKEALKIMNHTREHQKNKIINHL